MNYYTSYKHTTPIISNEPGPNDIPSHGYRSTDNAFSPSTTPSNREYAGDVECSAHTPIYMIHHHSRQPPQLS